MIDGHTQLVGLIGWPVEHSFSPAMHNAAFDALNLNWRYLPLPVPPGQVEAAVRGLAALGFRGANVTVPHKQAVIPVLDSLAPGARALGAVNTILVDRDEAGGVTLHGDNTDYRGFVGALCHGGFDPQEKRALLVGAGGAGRAVAYGLLDAGATDVLVLDVADEQAQALIANLGDDRLRTVSHTTKALIEAAREADLLVNATPLGMWPRIDGSIWPDDVPVPAHLAVFDLVYNPADTRLLQQARAAGAHPIEGLGMLVRQGVAAFEMWTGQEPPVDIMQAACQQALGRS